MANISTITVDGTNYNVKDTGAFTCPEYGSEPEIKKENFTATYDCWCVVRFTITNGISIVINGQFYCYGNPQSQYGTEKCFFHTAFPLRANDTVAFSLESEADRNNIVAALYTLRA